MNVRSLGRQTDLMFAEFSGSVEDRGDFLVVSTPDNPGYHWGNYLLWDRPPRVGDLKDWIARFHRELPYYPEPTHYLFTWDVIPPDPGDPQEFLAAGFDLDPGVVLTAGQLRRPPHWNGEVEVRPLEGRGEWEQAIRLQTLCADPKFLNDRYESFKRKQMARYEAMVEAGRGWWFGAFLKGALVGDLGIFYQGSVGRYQSVGTHPRYRNQGICQTLVYEAGRWALESTALSTLVMEADPEYHAARVYESVGFTKTELNYALCWWKGKGPVPLQSG